MAATPMDPSILLEDLHRQEEELRLELIEMEGKFNIKKEKYEYQKFECKKQNS